MARKTISWGDGSGDNIYLDYSAASGNQTVTVSSDANAGASPRSKTITFRTTAGSPAVTKTLTVTQAAALAPIYSLHKVFGGTMGDIINTGYALFGSSMQNWTLVSYAPDASLNNNPSQAAICCYDISAQDSSAKGLIRDAYELTQGDLYGGVSAVLEGVSPLTYCFDKVNKIFRSYNAQSPPSYYDNFFARSSEVPVAISREGNNYYYSLDGTTWTLIATLTYSHNVPLFLGCVAYLYQSWMAEYGITPNYPANNPIYYVGGYYNSNGSYLDMELYNVAKANVSSFINAHTT